MIYCSIETKALQVILPLFTSLVRPHLDYCVQAWRPHYLKDIVKLERVQRRAVKIIKELQGTTYEEKLIELKLFSLEKRRLRGDMITVFRMLKGIDNIDSDIFFTLFSSNNSTRGHSLKLSRPSVKTDTRKFFFSSRVVNLWNCLP